jgi:hypothetical protein
MTRLELDSVEMPPLRLAQPQPSSSAISAPKLRSDCTSSDLRASRADTVNHFGAITPYSFPAFLIVGFSKAITEACCILCVLMLSLMQLTIGGAYRPCRCSSSTHGSRRAGCAGRKERSLSDVVLGVASMSPRCPPLSSLFF